MSALIKCYYNEQCTSPVFFDVISYTLDMGPKSGLNGDAGEIVNQTIYIRNEGDTPAQNIQVKEVGDISDYFKISTPTKRCQSILGELGNLAPGETTWFILHTIIPKNTDPGSGIVDYTIEYFTLPKPIPEYITQGYTPPKHKLNYTETPHDDNAPAGRPYGHGPYGDPLYGQEGFIHKQLLVDTWAPIAGLAYTYLKGSYTINARYRGTEATIEDIQSYYTERYMALACFDGPALPLWLNKREDDT